MIPVLVIIVVISIAAVLAFRWFERYRYTDAWRTSEFRDWTFGFLMWFGGLFGHHVPPPPQTKIEYASRANDPEPPSGGAPLSQNAANDEE